MSLHNNSYLVSSHQSEMRRHAAEHRLASAERKITVAPATTPDAQGPTASPVRRWLVGLSTTLRPARRAGASHRV